MTSPFPERWSGYFVSVDRLDLGPSIVGAVAKAEPLHTLNKAFRSYIFTSREPLAGELKINAEQSFHYWVMVAQGEHFTLLVSENRRVAGVIIDELRKAHPRIVIRHARVEVHLLILFLMSDDDGSSSNSPLSRLQGDLRERLDLLLKRSDSTDTDFKSTYTVNTVLGKLLRDEHLVEKIAFYGNSVWQHDLFRQAIHDISAFYCGLRCITSQEDILSIGTEGFVSFSGNSNESLKRIISVLGYLVSRSIIHKRH